MLCLRVGLVLCACATGAHAEDRETWIEWLKGGETSAHQKAVEGLTREGPDAFADVAALLKESSAPVRRRAMTILVLYSKQLGDVDRNRRPLLKAFEDNDAQVQAAAGIALAYAGPRIVAKLFSFAGGKDRRLAERARNVLVATRERAVPYLSRKLTSTSKKIVLLALELLTRLGPAGVGAREGVVVLLSAPQREIRIGAYRAFASIEPDATKATGTLVAGLDDADHEIAYECGTLLRRHSQKAAEALVPRLATPSSLARDRALFALSMLDARAAPSLESQLKSPNPRSRTEAMRLLSKLGDPKRTTKLAIEMLRSGTPAERVAATRLLALRTADAEVVTKTLPALIDDEVKGVGDWAWFRTWWMRSGSLPKREPIETEVLARLGVARPRIAGRLIEESNDPATEVALHAIRGLGVLARGYRPGSPDLRGARFAALPEEVRRHCRMGWRWLVDNQRSDGLWSSGQKGGDIGVTALALLAFSAGGHSDGQEPYANTIRKGIDALFKRMDKSGFIGTTKLHQSTLQHLMATAAILDAYLVGSMPGRRSWAGDALKRMMTLRASSGGWGYYARYQKADLYHTIWATYAARLGTLADLLPKERYAPGVMDFVRWMSDPEFGQVGYEICGGSPSRSPDTDFYTMSLPWNRTSRGHKRFPSEKSQSMTAAGIWAYWLLDDPRRTEQFRLNGFHLMEELPPAWNREDGSIDMVFWHFAANALTLSALDAPFSRKRRDRNRKWYEGGVKILMDNQTDAGSWPPVGVWGAQGGQTYTTASGLLYLLAPAQFSADFFESKRDRRPGDYRLLFEALEKTRKSKDPRRAFAALTALRE